MKISKLIYIFVLLINLVLLTSCNKIKAVDDTEYFINVLKRINK